MAAVAPKEEEVPVRFLRAMYFPPSGPYFQEGDEAMLPPKLAKALRDRGRLVLMSPTSTAAAATVRA